MKTNLNKIGWVLYAGGSVIGLIPPVIGMIPTNHFDLWFVASLFIPTTGAVILIINTLKKSL